jgi:hypothetical protein
VTNSNGLEYEKFKEYRGTEYLITNENASTLDKEITDVRRKYGEKNHIC